MNTTKLKDGGPAFPGAKDIQFGQPQDNNEGMTLRQYFAAKASEQVPDWFKAKLTPLPDRPADAEFCQGCQADGDCLKTEPCKRATEWTARKIEVGMLNKSERFFQWRAYYADMMIATLESLSPTPTPAPFLPKEFIPSVKSSFNTIVNMIDAPYFDADRKYRIRMMAVESIRMIEAAEKCIGQ